MVPSVLDQSTAGFHQTLLQTRHDQLSILPGSAERRPRFPRL